VLTTNIKLRADELALKCKELRQVEHLSRDVQSILETRSIFHMCNESIRGRMCSGISVLVLRKDLCRHTETAGSSLEWSGFQARPEIPVGCHPRRKPKEAHHPHPAPGDLRKGLPGCRVAVPPTMREIAG